MAQAKKTDTKKTADFRQSTGACARAISRDASVNLQFDSDASDVDVQSQALPDIPQVNNLILW